MATIHNFSIAKDETKYFRYLNGVVSEIDSNEFTDKFGTSLVIAAYAGSKSVTVGAGAIGRTGDKALYAKFFGDSVFNYGKIFFILQDYLYGNPAKVQGDITPGTSSGGGSQGGSQSGGNVDFTVGDPAVAAPQPPQTTANKPLPTGNGNSGFTTTGSAGSELGIAGGNT